MDDATKAAFKKCAERIMALEARVAELESAPAKSTRKPKDVAEVAEYFKRHGLNGTADAEARRFFNFFESKGWKVGKNPMVKWRSAAANWIEGKIETVENKPRKPQINVDFYLKDRGDGVFEQRWIRDGVRTDDLFRLEDWQREIGLCV